MRRRALWVGALVLVGQPVGTVEAFLAAEAGAPRRKPGRWKGLVTVDDDLFTQPMSDEDLLDWEGDLDAFLMPPGPAKE